MSDEKERREKAINDEYNAETAKIDRDQKEEEAEIDAKWTDVKKDRLAEHVERLRDAQDAGGDFQEQLGKF